MLQYKMRRRRYVYTVYIILYYTNDDKITIIIQRISDDNNERFVFYPETENFSTFQNVGLGLRLQQHFNRLQITPPNAQTHTHPHTHTYTLYKSVRERVYVCAYYTFANARHNNVVNNKSFLLPPRRERAVFPTYTAGA